MENVRDNAGAVTRDVNQIRKFYEADRKTIFITFTKGYLYWCQPNGHIEVLSDGSRRMQTVSGWSNKSSRGAVLHEDRLSGQLLKVQMFRGTICDVGDIKYLLRKLNDELSPDVIEAEEAEIRLIAAIVKLMKMLTWHDFELLVDLVFSASGWRRVSRVGGTKKTIDIELVLPTIGERSFIQVKSQASEKGLKEYADRFMKLEAYDRMFFVWHSGTLSEVKEPPEGVILLGPTKLARMVLDAGLSAWLREKTL